jgi:hypothetical protein
MTALYEFHVLGKLDGCVPDIGVFLKLLEPVLLRVSADFVKARISNDKDDSVFEMEMNDAQIADITIKHGENVVFYGARDIVLVIGADERYWSVCLCLPVRDEKLWSYGVQSLTEDMYSMFAPLQPLYATAGDELEVFFYQCNDVVAGRLNPIDLAGFAAMSQPVTELYGIIDDGQTHTKILPTGIFAWREPPPKTFAETPSGIFEAAIVQND